MNPGEMKNQNFKSELIKWIKGFPYYWKKFLAIKILENNELTDQILNQTFNYILQEYDLIENDEALPKENLETLLERKLKGETFTKEEIYLKCIKDFKAISALQDGQKIELSPQITVLFGENGAGKSSYVRLFNNAFASRGETQILPNIYVDGVNQEPSCRFDFEANGKIISVAFPAEKEKPEFSLFTVFDSKSAKVHLDEKNEFLFIPKGFEFFNLLINGLDRLSNRLEEANKKRNIDNSFKLKFDPDKPVGSFIYHLNSQSSFEELEKLSQLTPIEEKELEKYQKEKARLVSLEIEEKIKEQEQFLDGLKKFRKQVSSLTQSIASDNIKRLNSIVKELEDKRKIVTQSGEKQFEQLGQKYAGKKEWKEFIHSAYSIVVKYEQEYPNKDSKCLFCGQNLTNETNSLIEKYWAFLKSTAAEELEETERKLVKKIKEIHLLDYPSLDEDTYLFHKLKSKEETKSLLKLWRSQLRDIQKAYRNLVQSIEERIIFKDDIPDFDIIKLDNLIKRETNQKEALIKHDPSKKIAELDEAIAELEERKELKKVLPEINRFLSNIKWIDKSLRVIKPLNTRTVTNKQRSMFEKYVAGDYLEIFKKECQKLKADFDIEINQQGRKGNTLRELKIRGHGLKYILSEGEQRAISLADFLTEIQVSSNNKGVIFDDPVNSLDHIRKKCIADRLIEESLARQVIIFTHDLMFLSYLKEASLAKEVIYNCHWVKKNAKGAGLVFLNNSPSNESDYKSAKAARTFYKKAKDAPPEEQEIYLKQGFGALRTNYEAFVIYELFNEVVLRFNERISIGRLKQVVVKEEVIEEVIKKSEKLSRFIEGHLHSDKFVFNKPTPELLFEEIEAFEQLRKKQKAYKKK